ncbi:hypothetical protein [Halorubrum sp. AJ67]|uniref:hypothetical protein n=1 Tax=Halorubrum sp. AJ67 TaxID=1173487 RepID=UPI000A54A043|nr:hypothetical protein [Halorubrum sp. AJ67]
MNDSRPDRNPDEETVEDRLARLVRGGRTNAIAAWAMVAVLVGVFVESWEARHTGG